MYAAQVLLFFPLISLLKHVQTVELDPLGYILYCPCMGRFGNQADHFLGALSFAHGLNRTLVLPPWVEYRYGQTKSIQVPFDTYFKVDPLQNYHKVITMEVFMSDIAPIEWPEDKRIAFCYTTRGEDNSCNAKHGNPFGPFWDTFHVDFVGSEFYGPLHYDTHNKEMAEQWTAKYPPDEWPVLAFTGAPAAFPVQPQNRALQKYLEWSDAYDRKADGFIRSVLPRGGFIGVHLRNGIDWVRACEHIPESPSLFAAAQCVGYRNEHGVATPNMCMPTKETILRQLKRTIKQLNGVKSVFVASDSNHMIGELNNGLQRIRVKVLRYPADDPHVDLAVLGRANHFIGNCVSSYSAFVKRERDANGLTSSFWGFPAEKEKKTTTTSSSRDEL